MEYWSLEQAKLSKFKSLDFEGKIILITGAGGDIGKSISKSFEKNGANHRAKCMILSKSV